MRSPKPQTTHPPTTYSQGSRSEMTACLSLPNAMNRLLKLTAIIEAATGLGLIAVPAIVVRLLLDAEMSGATIPLARVAGVALFALCVACWLARDDTPTPAAWRLAATTLPYNLGAVP